jgi:lipoprotein-anchoring transpeptidase ErfK/SrfK
VKFSGNIAAVAALLAVAGCNVNVENGAASNEDDQAQANQQGQNIEQEDPQAQARARELAARLGNQQQREEMRRQGRSENEKLRLVVDQSDRKVYIYRGDEEVRSHDVAVGTKDNPTPIGEFAFRRIDLNPRWVPPDSDWAEDRETKAPGDPENPMGRARLVYKPYTIHGTDNLDSLGKAVSHGSIRLANENVIPLAELLLKAGNSWQGEDWFREMTENRDEEFQIPLDENVPLTIRE